MSHAREDWLARGSPVVAYCRGPDCVVALDAHRTSRKWLISYSNRRFVQSTPLGPPLTPSTSPPPGSAFTITKPWSSAAEFGTSPA